MALIICEECKKEISSTAERCPHCGHKTAFATESAKKKDVTLAVYICLAAIVIGLFLLLPAFFTLVENYDDWYFWNWYTDRSNAVMRNLGIGTAMTGSGIGILLKLKTQAKKQSSDTDGE